MLAGGHDGPTYDVPAPTMKTSVSMGSLTLRPLIGADSNFSFSGCWTMCSTQVDQTQIFQETASSVFSDFVGNKTILPAQMSAGERVRKVKPHSMNIFHELVKRTVNRW